MSASEVKEAAPSVSESVPRAARNLVGGTKAYIRKNPARALAIAVGAGFVLQSAPVGRLVGGLLRISFALLQPALLIAGGVKIWEKIQRRPIL